MDRKYKDTLYILLIAVCMWILCMLVAVSATGQHAEIEKHVAKWDTSRIVQTDTDHLVMKWRKDNRINDKHIRLSDLIEYETHCYNDSTLVEVHKNDNEINEGVCQWPRCHHTHFKNVWRHREPTFSGFIKWLKGRKP